jgi:hypothetical protein
VKRTLTPALDPLGLGHVATWASLSPGVGQTWATANEGRFVRVISGGVISKIGLYVDTSSGNISVAVYSKSGSGRAAVPATRVVTSGAVACPGTGYQEVSLGSSVTVAPGDYLALSCDNTTAVFTCTGTGQTRSIFAPWAYAYSSAHPLPASPTGGSFSATTSKVPWLVGAA